MKKLSEKTKKEINKLWILRSIEVILLIVPLMVYSVIALASNTGLVIEKLTLVGMIVIALIIVGLNVLMKFKLRSPVWIVLIGLYVAMENIVPLIIMIAITTLVDEFYLTPAIKKQIMRVEANKVYDEREV